MFISSNTSFIMSDKLNFYKLNVKIDKLIYLYKLINKLKLKIDILTNGYRPLFC